MALSIKDQEADRLARKLAEETGETMTQAIVVALRERLNRLKRAKAAKGAVHRLDALWAELDTLPILDERGADQLLPYDVNGLPR